MPGKTQMVEELGEKELLLPNLVNRALVANDQAKYLMTLLQSAREYAEHPDQGCVDLKSERLACGLERSALDSVVEHSRCNGADVYWIPESKGIVDDMIGLVRDMLAPIQLVEELQAADGGGQGQAYAARLEALIGGEPELEGDRIQGQVIDRMTSAKREAGDSIHILVMDLHKELNRLQQTISSETLAGASVYGLDEDDRPLIQAFMAGVNRTKPLKFDHPGLSTTATRSGKKLAIQNDIGATDAHVLVVHVEDQAVTVTYTDVHMQRLAFFQGMFWKFPVSWEETRSRQAHRFGDGLYHLCQGRYEAQNRSDLEAYLAFLGSRLVFLIDWNRARKRLRTMVPKKVALEVLTWAADHDIGHMGFLKMGGERLIFDALRLSARRTLPISGQLADILGPRRVGEFLKFTLRTASRGLLDGRSELLIRDEVRAELRHYIETLHQGLLDLAAEQASLIVELSMAAQDALMDTRTVEDDAYLKRLAARAKDWEHRADELVSKGRNSGLDAEDASVIPELLRVADDAADELEEAVFLLSLVPNDRPEGPFADALHDLSALLVQSAQEYLKVVEHARQIHRGSSREQMEDFLESVDRTIALEHHTDNAQRRAKAAILSFAGDFKQLRLFCETADNLEQAADVLMRSALMLKDYILGEVITR
jgi:uncharacterized protein Yka (UPF0111/DUF47 family)